MSDGFIEELGDEYSKRIFINTAHTTTAVASYRWE